MNEFWIGGGFLMIAGAEWLLIHEAGGAGCGVAYALANIGP